MTRLRIRTRRHRVDGRWAPPDWLDVVVLVVRDDGTEVPLDNVTSIAWFAAAQTPGPLRVHLTLANVEVDVEGEAPSNPPRDDGGDRG